MTDDGIIFTYWKQRLLGTTEDSLTLMVVFEIASEPIIAL